MNLLDKKNQNIENIKHIMQNEYLNFNVLENIDMDPNHYINHIQFGSVISNYASNKDPHFYQMDVLSSKNIVKLILNEEGYICADLNFVSYEDIATLLEKNYKKIVLDLRSLPLDWYDTYFILRVACNFEFVKKKLLSMKTIIEYKDKLDNVVYKIYNKNGNIHSLNYMNGKDSVLIKLKDIKSYDSEDIVAITNDNNIVSYIFNLLGVPIYTNNTNTDINFLSYKVYEIMGYKILIPDVYLVNSHKYEIEGPIKNEYYPNI